MMLALGLLVPMLRSVHSRNRMLYPADSRTQVFGTASIVVSLRLNSRISQLTRYALTVGRDWTVTYIFQRDLLVGSFLSALCTSS